MQGLFARTPCGPARMRDGGLRGSPEGGARAHPADRFGCPNPACRESRGTECGVTEMALGRKIELDRRAETGTPRGEFGFATLRDAAPGCGASVRERGGKDGPPVKGDGSILRAESREPRAESREPRAESREPRAESREPRAESREPRAESREPRAESREPRAESREPRAESREPRAESREPRAESREPRAESREPRAESREPRAESREPRAESREPRAESRAYDCALCAGARLMSGPSLPV